MTTTALSVSLPTLLDKMKMKNPDGTSAQVVELLTKNTEILQDMVWREGNSETGHVITSRTSLPSVTWRKINGGVTVSKSSRHQVTETPGMCESWSAIDAKEVELNGGAEFRMDEDIAHSIAMNNEMTTAVFYHSTKSDPERPMGLAPRFNATTDPGGGQIVIGDSGASGNDQTTLWLIFWGPGVYGFYPKGTDGGLHSEDLGRIPWDSNDTPGSAPAKFMAYVRRWEWNFGVAVADWRSIACVRNIDTSAIVADAATGTDLIQSAVKAYHKVPAVNRAMGRGAWYCSKTVGTYLHLHALASANSTISFEEVAGRPVTRLLGLPVREVDAITDAEAAIS
jgi:hypothetical protein